MALASAALLSAQRPAPAHAQETHHWPRHHAVPPLSDILPDYLAAPPSPAENSGRDERPTRELVRSADGSFTYEETAFTASVDGEGRVSFHDKPSLRGNLLFVPFFVAFHGTFDATDFVMRWLGEDPYRYQKAQFLERTFEERVRMRRLHTQRSMERAIARLPRYLEAVWRHEEWSLELRRRVLFALWDECAEEGNALLVRGGREARAVIETFVRANLAPGTAHAFTEEELARLNALRTSRQRFAPYVEPGPGATMVVADYAALRPFSRH